MSAAATVAIRPTVSGTVRVIPSAREGVSVDLSAAALGWAAGLGYYPWQDAAAGFFSAPAQLSAVLMAWVYQ